MPNTTKNYQLNQWEPGDNFLRTDFNADNAKIDAALTQKCEVVFGSYTGDGTASRVISLGFTPGAVYLCSQSGMAGCCDDYDTSCGGLAFAEHPVKMKEEVVMEIVENGFRVTQGGGSANGYRKANDSSRSYHYIAFK